MRGNMEENIQVTERDNIDFSVKKVTLWGFLSCAMIWLELVSFTASIVISYKENGEAGPLLGLAGVLIVFFAIAGANFGYLGLKKKGRIRHTLDWFGLAVNLVVLVLIAALYVFGTSTLS